MKSLAKLAIILWVILVMGNLSAVIDHFLHPAIPYFHKEHLIAGAVSVLVAAFFIIIPEVYVESLHKNER